MTLVVTLFVAGHETTMNLIGNGLLALLRNPDQLAALREDPGLGRNAVDELLRYDSPVQLTARVAREPVEIGGKSVQPGEFVIAVLGAANRDPEVFPDPDRLDVTRPEIRHVSFGHGAHFCLGAPLARLEGQVAFTALLRRFPNLRDAAGTVGTNYGLTGLPTTFILDRDGRIAAALSGPQTVAKVERALAGAHL